MEPLYPFNQENIDQCHNECKIHIDSPVSGGLKFKKRTSGIMIKTYRLSNWSPKGIDLLCSLILDREMRANKHLKRKFQQNVRCYKREGSARIFLKQLI